MEPDDQPDFPRHVRLLTGSIDDNTIRTLQTTMETYPGPILTRHVTDYRYVYSLLHITAFPNNTRGSSGDHQRGGVARTPQDSGGQEEEVVDDS